MADLIVRPTLSAGTQRAFAKRRNGSIWGLSYSWFTKGGLGVDSDGVFLLDADGVRHPIPMPANAELVRVTMKGSLGVDAYRELPEVFFADEQHYRIAQLPYQGFEDTDFSEFARAAGVRWVDLGELSVGAHGVYGGYPYTSQMLGLQDSITAEADKRHGGLFHRHRSN